MDLRFEKLQIGHEYERPYLAELWGYKSFQAISMGVVTPAGENHIRRRQNWSRKLSKEKNLKRFLRQSVQHPSQFPSSSRSQKKSTKNSRVILTNSKMRSRL